MEQLADSSVLLLTLPFREQDASLLNSPLCASIPVRAATPASWSEGAAEALQHARVKPKHSWPLVILKSRHNLRNGHLIILFIQGINRVHALEIFLPDKGFSPLGSLASLPLSAPLSVSLLLFLPRFCLFFFSPLVPSFFPSFSLPPLPLF